MEIERMLIAMAWERAKGALREAVAGIGALPVEYSGVDNLHLGQSSYQTVQEEVEAFIILMDRNERFG